MFRVNQHLCFSRTVSLIGGGAEQSFGVTFVALPVSRVAEVDEVEAPEEIQKLMCEVIIDLADIVDEQDQPIPYSLDLRRQVLENVEALPALLAEYRLGLIETMRGNSARLPAPGRTAA